MKNLGYSYYKEYFKNLEFHQNESGDFFPSLQKEKTKTFIKSFFEAQLTNYNPPVIDIADNYFELITIYPGLLIGSGYNHEIGKQENELKLGFFFDHTTGLPCIPGSSVKGVLRDACEKDNGGYAVGIIEELKRKNEFEENIKIKLSETEPKKLFLKSGNQPSEFVNHVFNGKKDKDNYRPFKERDIFFDAFPVESKNENGKFLANDYITHHENPLKNPNPVQFMKLLPQVIFQFNFRLTDCCIKKEIKLELFKQILLDFGVGAKTNVGYGQFEEVENNSQKKV